MTTHSTSSRINGPEAMTVWKEHLADERTDAPPGPGDGEPSLFSALGFLLAYRSHIIGAALLCASVAFVTTLVGGPVYRAESRFLPQAASGSTSRIAGLAAQFGIDVGAAAGGQSSAELYAGLVHSRQILGQVAQTKLPLTRDTSPAAPRATIVELYGITNDDADQQLLDAVTLLRKRLVSVRSDIRTGIVTIETEAKQKAVAEGMNQRVLDLVTDFNLRRRQSQAGAEREFLEARTVAAQQELRRAESRLAAFLTQNREFRSPQLSFENARLQREVDLAQQVYTSLAQTYEQARVEEVRNTPVITIIDSPIGSAKRSRGLVRKTAIGFVLGAVFGLVLALLVEHARRRRETHPEEYDALVGRARRLLPGTTRRGEESR